jgi:hypothetical protein
MHTLSNLVILSSRLYRGLAFSQFVYIEVVGFFFGRFLPKRTTPRDLYQAASLRNCSSIPDLLSILESYGGKLFSPLVGGHK